MAGYIEKKYESKKKTLLILVAILAFLVTAYAAGEITWTRDILLFVELFSSVIAVFIGILALVRFYTKKSRLNFLVLGIGFLFVGVLEIVQILSSLGSFGDLFSYSQTSMFPLSIVLATSFLSILIFLSWFLRKDYENVDLGKEKKIFVCIFILFVCVIGGFLLFTNVFNSFGEYIPAIIADILSLVLFTLTALGYFRGKTWKYDSFDYWLLFSTIFLIVSCIFFVPFFNLEYEILMKFTVFARFFSYILLLVGFLVSIYEMSRREVDFLEELKQKNEQLVQAKNNIEEAYMMLRKEKWALAKDNDVVKNDKILKDIVKSKV